MKKTLIVLVSIILIVIIACLIVKAINSSSNQVNNTNDEIVTTNGEHPGEEREKLAAQGFGGVRPLPYATAYVEPLEQRRFCPIRPVFQNGHVSKASQSHFATEGLQWRTVCGKPRRPVDFA